jgi:hypothetical protein
VSKDRNNSRYGIRSNLLSAKKGQSATKEEKM